MKFVADYTFNHRLDMRGDELREGRVNLFVTGRPQQGFKQSVGTGWELFQQLILVLVEQEFAHGIALRCDSVIYR